MTTTRFIGQTRIINELDEYIIPAMKQGKNLNILFRASSGCGKTTLAASIANELTKDPEEWSYTYPDEDGIIYMNLDKRIIVIDEIHMLEQPELLYPHMDSNNHIFILCTNEGGELKEPLINRCIEFIFDKYSEEEIMAILYTEFIKLKISLQSKDVLQIIANNCNANPRITKHLAERLSIIFNKRGIPNNSDEIIEILKTILQLEDGLNPYHRLYLEKLKKLGGRASLNTLHYATLIDKNMIQRDVEPILLQKELITITSKGRCII
jgi:Holliday junction resolvasome RuvABC ATP-dependent DNA helicase subunit